MAAVTCNRCGLVFPTEARAITRCRRCRHVVNIGHTPRGTTAESELAPARPEDVSDETADPGSASPLVNSEWRWRPVASGASGMGGAVLLGVGVWVAVEAVRGVSE